MFTGYVMILKQSSSVTIMMSMKYCDPPPPHSIKDSHPQMEQHNQHRAKYLPSGLTDTQTTDPINLQLIQFN